jgi:hypothetical protein
MACRACESLGPPTRCAGPALRQRERKIAGTPTPRDVLLCAQIDVIVNGTDISNADTTVALGASLNNPCNITGVPTVWAAAGRTAKYTCDLAYPSGTINFVTTKDGARPPRGQGGVGRAGGRRARGLRGRLPHPSRGLSPPAGSSPQPLQTLRAPRPPPPTRPAPLPGPRSPPPLPPPPATPRRQA